jgi:NhaA family Na+:H+ antiporter
MTVAHLVGVGCIAGMGFTVSLFIANLSFRGAQLDTAKIAILSASVVAAVLGVLAILGAERRRPSVKSPTV